MKRQSYFWGCVVAIAAGAGGYTIFLACQKVAAPAVEFVEVGAGHEVLAPADVARLPADRELFPATDSAECRGVLVSGHAKWEVGEPDQKNMLWDEGSRHLVVLLPNDKLTELQEKLTPKWAGWTKRVSTATVVANGKLTRYHGVNYLLMSSFEILPAPKPVGDAKPKADANEKAAVSPVADLVKEGVAARYERKDIAAAEKAWEQALALLDQPGVTPMDRYQVYAGLGLIFAERQVFAKAKVFFQKAVAASRDISDNRKPLSYSHYNQACAEALLGEAEASLASLRAALEAERLTDRRRYGKMAGSNASFAALKDDPRFKAILKEFTDPAVTAPTGSKSWRRTERAIMCLGIPGKVIETHREYEILMGKVDFGGVLKRVCLEHVPEARPGDYVLVHVGFALSMIDEVEALRVFAFLDGMDDLGELRVPSP